MKNVLLLVLLCQFFGSLAMDTVTVNSAQQFIDSVQSDRLIFLQPGIYNLSTITQLETIDLSKKNTDLPLTSSVAFTTGDGVIIKQVNNLKIVGLGEKPEDCVIQTSNLSDDALIFLGCTNINLKNIKATHDPEMEGSSQGGIITINQCEGVQMDNNVFSGKAAVGLRIFRSKNITITNTTVTGCSELTVDFKDSWTLKLNNCLFEENRICSVFWSMIRCTDVKVENCTFADNIQRVSRNCQNSKLFTVLRCEMVSFSGNSSRGNECNYFGDSEAVRIIEPTNAFKRNKFDSMTIPVNTSKTM